MTLSADTTALLVCGTTCPTWDDAGVQAIMDNFITPTQPGRDITPVAVKTPEELWPLTGILRLLGLVAGDPNIFGPGGPAWPDEPWWKLTGFFDRTGNQSVEAGAAELEDAMLAHPGDDLVIYGLSQGAGVALTVKKRLAAQYPDGTEAPNVDFVLQGDVNVPNGGLQARLPGLYIPILDWTFTGPEPTDTQFDTVVISRQYDGFSDFPLYPLSVIADVNALLGIVFLHTRPFDVSLPEDPTESLAYQGTHGDSSYYFFESPDLPLFAPLRMLGVPEPFIDVVEPFFRVLVELGYDRSIPIWEPTPARLFPKHDMVTVLADLGDAVEEGVDNALALIGLPPLGKTTSTFETSLAVEPYLADETTMANEPDTDEAATVEEIEEQDAQASPGAEPASDAEVDETKSSAGEEESDAQVAETSDADLTTPEGSSAATEASEPADEPSDSGE
ncbi:PE-PPE domain-containing protein [Mycobacterium sp. 236(2023)]|uniref:PE-PPE domain-containing protein n=1 Tax=Mycobacterium sp. 236(2023) TaxID=3038163 RepID=UPI002415060F|nr:PE-PPE domain-containing protein [Mycobacterium sp. 236(2023)]MDG4667557.1 PE-PPE domain-containing protein [Mycobacterium sp. 236(2023)]